MPRLGSLHGALFRHPLSFQSSAATNYPQENYLCCYLSTSGRPGIECRSLQDRLKQRHSVLSCLNLRFARHSVLDLNQGGFRWEDSQRFSSFFLVLLRPLPHLIPMNLRRSLSALGDWFRSKGIRPVAVSSLTGPPACSCTTLLGVCPSKSSSGQIANPLRHMRKDCSAQPWKKKQPPLTA